MSAKERDRNRLEKLREKINLKGLVGIAAVLILVTLIFNINQRLTELDRLTSDRDQVATQAFEIKQTEVKLATLAAYAGSGEAVEDYAETHRMTKDGGTIMIIPLPDENITPTPAPVPTATPFIYEKIDVWKQLFFGD